MTVCSASVLCALSLVPLSGCTGVQSASSSNLLFSVASTCAGCVGRARSLDVACSGRARSVVAAWLPRVNVAIASICGLGCAAAAAGGRRWSGYWCVF